MQSLTYIDLFAGIGGFSLGLDMVGFTCVGHVEINPYCQKILKKHWPGVKLSGFYEEFEDRLKFISDDAD